MLLIARFWQFFAGCAAFYAYENSLFDFFTTSATVTLYAECDEDLKENSKI